jgi:hypothetical protein
MNKMKTSKKVVFTSALLLTGILLAFSVFSQKQESASSKFKLSIENVKLTSDKTVEFDLYLLNTEPAATFELALFQAGILVNPDIFNGGTIKASLIDGGSQLIDVQQPLNILFAQETNIIKLPSRTLKPLAKDAPAGPRGSIISSKGEGTRICRIMLTNTMAFSKGPVKLAFNLNKIPYPTSISHYVSGVNTPLNCNENNCIVKP